MVLPVLIIIYEEEYNWKVLYIVFYDIKVKNSVKGKIRGNKYANKHICRTNTRNR